VILFLIGYLPLTEEWWRFRSDAWFHRAVVVQVGDYGIPPEDPYFAGYELQYMWFYHILIVLLSRATALDPFFITPLLNLQSFCGFVLGTVLLAGLLKRRFAFRFSSVLTVVLGLNGFFWLFLPVKAVRAFFGEVTGFSEIARQYSLNPFTARRVEEFLTILYNQDFLLDKFVVTTALGLSLCCMTAFWYGTTRYLAVRRPSSLILTSLALLGMLGFHTMVGIVMLIGLFGAFFMLFLLRSRLTGYSLKSCGILSGVCLASILLISPYLYTIMRLKESEQLVPIGLSFTKTVGILVTCASVLFLTAFQKTFFRRVDVESRFFLLATLSIVLFCLFISLPGPNTYDKLPLFIFYPLAVVGGWTFVDYLDKQRPGRNKAAATLLIALLFLVPVNALSFAAYFADPTKEMYTEDEKSLAAWVREHTTRESVFIDGDKEVFLLVAGPRRYFCGYMAYADFWGYNKTEMAARARARDMLLSDKSLDQESLRLLGTVEYDLYVIDRVSPDGNGPSVTLAAYPQLFEPVHAGGSLSLYRVDTRACLEAAAGERTLPVHSEEE
jgi:hypothetical protein